MIIGVHLRKKDVIFVMNYKVGQIIEYSNNSFFNPKRAVYKIIDKIDNGKIYYKCLCLESDFSSDVGKEYEFYLEEKNWFLLKNGKKVCLICHGT